MSYRDKSKPEERVKKRSSVGLRITLAVLSFVIVLTILSFTSPEILIGWYIDNDIRTQLLDVHQSKLDSRNTVLGTATTDDLDDLILNVRFTFDNDQIVDIRVSRAIDVFNELFEGHERDHTVFEGEESTILELRWAVDKNG